MIHFYSKDRFLLLLLACQKGRSNFNDKTFIEKSGRMKQSRMKTQEIIEIFNDHRQFWSLVIYAKIRKN